MSTKFVILTILFCFYGCSTAQTQSTNSINPTSVSNSSTVAKITNSAKVIHVLVALCDNENQGIVPVPAFLGNGEDTQRNLYCGLRG